MSLGKKTLVIITAIFLSLIVVLYLAARVLLLGCFASLEEDQARKHTLRALNTLNHEIDHLGRVVGDWGPWTETYAFMREKNKAFIEDNFSTLTLGNLEINLALLVQPDKKILYGTALDTPGDKVRPLPAGLEKHLTAEGFLPRAADLETSAAGIAAFPEGIMLVATHSIVTSEHRGPPRGWLIMGQWLDGARAQRLGLKLEWVSGRQPLDTAKLPSVFPPGPPLQAGKNDIRIQRLSDQTISGYALLNDLASQPALLLRVDTPRHFYQSGRTSIFYLILVILVVGIVWGALTLLLLKKMVLARLIRLTGNLIEIGADRDGSARVPVAGKDEIATLADSINQMLERLERSARFCARRKSDCGWDSKGARWASGNGINRPIR